TAGCPHHLFHRRAERGAGLDRHRRHPRAAGRGGHPHRFREGLHPRRDHSLRRLRGARRRGRRARRRQASSRRQGLRSQGRRRAPLPICDVSAELRPHGSSRGLRLLLTARTKPHSEDGRRSVPKDKVLTHRSAAAMLPPSTASTWPVVLCALASTTKACATSSASTSRPSRLPLMYSASETPLAFARSAIMASVSSPLRTRSALTPFERMRSLP